MKKLYILALAALALMSGCSKETEDNSFITELPTLELLGNSPVYLDIDDKYEEAGISAVVDGVPTSQCTIIGEVGTEPGAYSIIYKVYNSDGAFVYKVRNVYINDPTFKTFWFGNFDVKRSDGKFYNKMFLTFTRNGNSIKVSDVLGGYYEQGRLLGIDYASEGTFGIDETPDADGWVKITGLLKGGHTAWDDYVSSVTGKFNVKTGELEMDTFYAGYHFVTSNIK